jgi:DNA-directed RNA polymerase specialized sigma24 family protein
MSTAAKPAPFGPDLRSALVAMVRKRVPESEVEDIVQTALAEAIDSPHAPTDSESLRRWIFGVAKNKVVDYHRRAGRESFDLPDVPGTPAPHVEADLLRWAEKNLPEGDENQKTLDWMLREGEGEKLESIAASEKLPPPRVRQRVSRLRRHFKENWQREVAMLAALGVIVSAIVIYVLRKPEVEPITHDVVDPRAEPVRRLALEKCAAADWKNCVDGLDEAKRLDPAGDARPEVKRARQAAEDAAKSLAPEPTAPPTAPSAAPLPTTAPPESSATPPLPMKMKAPPAKPESTAPIPVPTPAPKMDRRPEGKKASTPTPEFGGSDFGGSVSEPASKDSKAPVAPQESPKGSGAMQGSGKPGPGTKK